MSKGEKPKVCFVRKADIWAECSCIPSAPLRQRGSFA
jgi:hypothetical protein